MPKRVVAGLAALAVAMVVALWGVHAVGEAASGASAGGASTGSATTGSASTGSATGEFDMRRNSLTASASYWVIVNKHRPLTPKTYEPADLVPVPVAHVGSRPLLRRAAADATVTMFAAFTDATGLTLRVQSGYRSYADQVATYDEFRDRLGTSEADDTTARPGYSEHQTGLALDVSAPGCNARDCFAATPQAAWVAANAWRYGFVLRYPDGYEKTTGYEYEPWHLRYVGPTLSTEVHRVKAATLEGFFGLKKAATYAG